MWLPFDRLSAAARVSCSLDLTGPYHQQRMSIKPAPQESYYFVSIQLNVSALTYYRDMMERFIEELRGKIPGWVNPDSPTGQIILFHDGLVRSLLPITLRSSFLVAAWSLYESTILEIASFLSEQLKSPPMSASVGRGFFAKTDAYYATTLGFSRDATSAVTDELRLLYGLRNAIAHGGGRAGAVSDEAWRELTGAAEHRGDFTTARSVIEPSPDLVYKMGYLVQDAVNRVIKQARGRLAAES